MKSRAAVKAAKAAAKEFIKAVERWEKEYPDKKPSECVGGHPHYSDWRGFGNRHSGEVTAQSLILTRRLADLRR